MSAMSWVFSSGSSTTTVSGRTACRGAPQASLHPAHVDWSVRNSRPMSPRPRPHSAIEVVTANEPGAAAAAQPAKPSAKARLLGDPTTRTFWGPGGAVTGAGVVGGPASAIGPASGDAARSSGGADGASAKDTIDRASTGGTTTQATRASSAATAGTATRVPWVLSRRPDRIGCSSTAYEATASPSVTASRTTRSGQNDQPVRSGLTTRNTGQWYRYTP